MSKFNKQDVVKSLAIVAAISLVVAMVVAYPVAYRGTATYTTITVTGKDRVVYSSGETTTSKYLVYTDAETFENTDSLLFGKFSSSDIHGRLHEGKKYNVLVAGWRIPVFSSHRNIISASEVK